MDQMSLYVTIGQMIANVSIIWALLRSHIKKVERLITEFNEDRVKIEMIGSYLANKDSNFKHIWESTRKIELFNGGKSVL